jgi:WD40 repeat protein
LSISVRADLVLVLFTALGAGFCWQASRPPQDSCLESSREAVGESGETGELGETPPMLISSLAWASDGQQIYVSGNRPDHFVHFSKAADEGLTPTPLEWSLPGATAVEWLSQTELLVGNRSGEVLICSPSKPARRLCRLPADATGIHQVLRHGSERLLAAADETVVALDRQGRTHWKHRSAGRITNVTTSANGRRVGVSTACGRMEILDGETGEILHALRVSGTWTHGAISPDGGRAYVAKFPGTLCAFDVATGTLLWERSPPEAMVFFVAVGPHGRTVFTGGPGSTAHLWSDAGEELETFEQADVRMARFSPEGARVAFSTTTGDLMLVDVPLSATVRNDPGNRSHIALETAAFETVEALEAD